MRSAIPSPASNGTASSRGAGNLFFKNGRDMTAEYVAKYLRGTKGETTPPPPAGDPTVPSAYRKRLTLTAPYDLSNFPFDSQILPLEVAHTNKNSPHVMQVPDSRHMETVPVEDIKPQEWTYTGRNVFSDQCRRHDRRDHHLHRDDVCRDAGGISPSVPASHRRPSGR